MHDFYLLYKEEEYKLVRRHRLIAENQNREKDDNEQDRIDRVLFGLFFHKQNAVVSENVIYDPSTR